MTSDSLKLDSWTSRIYLDFTIGARETKNLFELMKNYIPRGDSLSQIQSIASQFFIIVSHSKKKRWSYLKLWERSVVAMKTASSSWSHDDVALNSRCIWLTSVSDFNINLTCCWNQILVSWPVDLYSYLQHEARERSAIDTPRISFLFSRRFSETFFHSSTRKSSILRVLNQFLTFENSFSASSIMELLNKVTAHGFISCLQCKSIAGQLRTFHVTKWQVK